MQAHNLLDKVDGGLTSEALPLMVLAAVQQAPEKPDYKSWPDLQLLMIVLRYYGMTIDVAKTAIAFKADDMVRQMSAPLAHILTLQCCLQDFNVLPNLAYVHVKMQLNRACLLKARLLMELPRFDCGIQ